VEKEYLKPSYTASIGAELEDGLFDGKCLTLLWMYFSTSAEFQSLHLQSKRTGKKLWKLCLQYYIHHRFSGANSTVWNDHDVCMCISADFLFCSSGMWFLSQKSLCFTLLSIC